MEEEHHYTAASDPGRVDPAINRATALEALKNGPRGALLLAGWAVALLFIGWLLFYFVLFMGRGIVG